MGPAADRDQRSRAGQVSAGQCVTQGNQALAVPSGWPSS